MDGRVLQVNVSAGGVPKLPVERAWVGELGLDGDGHNHDTVHGGPHRAVALLAIEAIERVQADGHPIEPGSVGENLTTTGIERPPSCRDTPGDRRAPRPRAVAAGQPMRRDRRLVSKRQVRADLDPRAPDGQPHVRTDARRGRGPARRPDPDPAPGAGLAGVDPSAAGPPRQRGAGRLVRRCGGPPSTSAMTFDP